MRQSPEPTKQCSHCLRVKPHSAFDRNRQHSDGRASRCKVCRSPSNRTEAQRQRIKRARDRRELQARRYLSARGLAAEKLLRDLRNVGLSDAAVPIAAALVVALDDEARAHRELPELAAAA